MLSVNFVYALLVGTLPALLWLFFWLREDASHPEPRWLIAFSFLGGGIVVVASIFAQEWVRTIVDSIELRYTIWAAIEELFKLGVVSLIALKTVYNDEPTDAMIYLITIALGFSAIENVLFAIAPFADGNIVGGIVSNNMRFLGASLIHIVCSATIGFALGVTMYRKKIVRILATTVGVIVAITIHSLFNISIINANQSNLNQIFIWVWLATIILMILFEEIKAVRNPAEMPLEENPDNYSQSA